MKVRKWMKVSLGIVGGLLAFFVVLCLTLAILVQNKSFQNKVLQQSVELLSEQLQTHVAIDSIDISFVSQRIHLYGLSIDDQQQRPMLHLDRLAVHLDMWELLSRHIRISKAEVEGLSAQLLKPKNGEPANYQFLIDAFKKPKSSESGDSVPSAPPSQPLQFDLNHLEIHRVQVFYNDMQASFASLEYRRKHHGRQTATLTAVQATWTSQTKKGPKDNTLAVASLRYDEKHDRVLHIDSLQYRCDNRLPRKNTGKPHRGFFDVGHLDFVASLQVTLQHYGKDTLALSIDRCWAKDSVTGFDIPDLHLQLQANRQALCIKDLVLQQRHTVINIDSAHVQLPDTSSGRCFQYQVPQVRAQTILQDIARPFAPVLSKFTMPLQLTTTMSGDTSSVSFRDIKVFTQDRRLTIHADGDIQNLRHKEQLAVRFRVHKMQAKGNVKHQILDQLPVKKLMMEAFDALGSISYSGKFAVLWRKEQFGGLLTTEAGNLNFFFTIDENNKYITGTAETKDFQIAKVVDAPKVGPVSFNAKYKIDISKQRTALMRQQKGGKLPIGSITGRVHEASYKGVKARNLDIDIESDGALATGSVLQHGSYVDLSCNFTMTSTTSIHQVKVKPKIKIHGLSDEDKQARAERKAQKRQERAARKEQKRQEREARRAKKQ